MSGCRPSQFPMQQNLKIDLSKGIHQVDAGQYRSFVRRLIYLQATRLNIAYSVNILSQFVSDLRQTHMDDAPRILRYFKATLG